MNITITVPAGSSDHGNPHLLCTPPSWYDYVVFYFSNYFAHAATVITTPGQGRNETIFVVLSALLLPGSGVVRAMNAIRRCSRFESDPVKRAVRAGALCMVVSTKAARSVSFTEPEPSMLEQGVVQVQEEPGGEKGFSGATNDADTPADAAPSTLVIPEAGTEVAAQPESPWWNPPRPRWIPNDAVVHGQFHLPPGYTLATVPISAAPHLKSLDQASCERLASSYNLPEILISFIQAIWAIITLYRARGDQIQQYGYAAFGLTVAPYAYMSVMNILGSFMNPEYAALFLLRTPVMDDAEAAGGFFRGEVASEVVDAPQLAGGIRATFDDDSVLSQLGVVIGCVPLAVIGGLSKFHSGDTSSLQRGFTMSWVVLGIVCGPILQELAADMGVIGRGIGGWDLPYLVGMSLMYGVAAIGGMVVVGLMIRDYGVCTLLS